MLVLQKTDYFYTFFIKFCSISRISLSAVIMSCFRMFCSDFLSEVKIYDRHYFR